MSTTTTTPVTEEQARSDLAEIVRSGTSRPVDVALALYRSGYRVAGVVSYEAHQVCALTQQIVGKGQDAAAASLVARGVYRD